MKKISFVVFTGAFLLLTACGKNEVLNKQENQRSDLGPELQATWRSHCEGKRVHQITLQGEQATFERVDFFDPECQDKARTTRHAGKFNLAHNYKEGVLNSIIFIAENDVKVTLHNDTEVEEQNNTLARLGKETEKEIDIKETPAQKKFLARENLKLRAVKALPLWKRDEEKPLNRLQLEKLKPGLAVEPVTEQGSRVSIKYEFDNGYLQIAGAGDFARVYTKN